MGTESGEQRIEDRLRMSEGKTKERRRKDEGRSDRSRRQVGETSLNLALEWSGKFGNQIVLQQKKHN